jgi:hypothetical protein
MASSNDRIAKLVRNAEQARVPLMGIVGDNEMQNNTLSIRSRNGWCYIFPSSSFFLVIDPSLIFYSFSSWRSWCSRRRCGACPDQRGY